MMELLRLDGTIEHKETASHNTLTDWFQELFTHTDINKDIDALPLLTSHPAFTTFLTNKGVPVNIQELLWSGIQAPTLKLDLQSAAGHTVRRSG